MTGQRTLAVVALLAVSALCVATVEIRTYETGDAHYRFLVWNLILAWVLLIFAIAYSRARGLSTCLWRCRSFPGCFSSRTPCTC
jgi:hypothetical protein